jgi:hypothetical protein
MKIRPLITSPSILATDFAKHGADVATVEKSRGAMAVHSLQYGARSSGNQRCQSPGDVTPCKSDKC